MSEENAKLLRALKRRHPDYVGKLAHWAFLAETYKGGRDWFKTNIFRYLKEGDQEFKDRLHRAYRFNHTREIVDLVQKYIFKSPVTRNETDASPEVQTFWKDATLNGLDIDQFMRLVSTASSIDGRVWVFVDNNKRADAITIADVKKQGAKVYAYIVRALDALDMGFDEDTGALNWILVREKKRDDEDPLRCTGVVEERYRLWTREGWTLYRIQDRSKTATNTIQQVQPSALQANPLIANYVEHSAQASTEQNEEVIVVDKGEHNLGEVPCFPVDNVIGDNAYAAPALIEDIAYLDRAIANYLSCLDAIIQDQTFSQLAMPAQGLLPGDDKYDALREMGTKRIFTYDGEGGGKPEYLSPDVKQAQVITDTINKIIHEIYHSVGMAGERTKQDNAAGIDNSSGVAKAYDFERLNSLLTTKSSALQNAENRLVRLVEMWHGAKPPKTDLVKYADTFDVRSLFDEFTVAERLSLIGAPDTIRRAQMRQVKDKLFPLLPKKESDEMEKDLEKWPPPPEPLSVTGTMTGMPPSKFPAKGSQAAKRAQTPASKNPQTQNRQGQVTSETK